MSRHLRDTLGFQVPIWLDGRAEDRGIEPLRLQAAVQRFVGCPVPTPGVSSEAAPATRWLYQTFRMDLCDIHHNHQIPFLIWEADKCLVVNAEVRAREIAPCLSGENRDSLAASKSPPFENRERMGHPAT